jgi:hypothetical protein
LVFLFFYSWALTLGAYLGRLFLSAYFLGVHARNIRGCVLRPGVDFRMAVVPARYYWRSGCAILSLPATQKASRRENGPLGEPADPKSVTKRSQN